MPRDLILPLSILMSLTGYGLIARWYVMPALRRLARGRALLPVLLFRSVRFVGLAFLIPGVTTQELDQRFANPAPTATCWRRCLRSWLSLPCVESCGRRFRWFGCLT